MFKAQILCDFCEKPLNRLSRTREWDTRKIFPHLCESCATKLDIAFEDCKRGIPVKAAIMARNTERNAERKKKLGTKG